MSKASRAADELLAAFHRSIPPKKQRMSEQDWAKALGRFHDEARAIRQRLSLGVIGRARSAFLLQQTLLDQGFPADVVRKLVFALVLNAFTGRV